MKNIIFLLFIVSSFFGCSGDESQPKTCEDIPEFTTNSIGDISAVYINPPEQIDVPETLMIAVQLTPEITQSSHNEKNIQNKAMFEFSIFPKAQALSCVSPKYHEMISYIEITSDADFDEEHPAGTSLNDLFSAQFLRRSMEDVLYNDPLYTHGFTLSLKALPKLNNKHNLTMKISLDSGKEFILDLEEASFNI